MDSISLGNIIEKNTEKLSKETLSKVIQSTSVSDNHTELLKMLKINFPVYQFQIISVRDGSHQDAGIVDNAGNRVSYDLTEWLKQEVALADGDVRNVWQRHKDSGLVRTRMVCSDIYISASYGNTPDSFIQIEISAKHEETYQDFFESSTTAPPQKCSDLIYGHWRIYEKSNQKIISNISYCVEKVVDIKKFMAELIEAKNEKSTEEAHKLGKMADKIGITCLESEIADTSKQISILTDCPECLNNEPKEIRLFRDWHKSSAGRNGHIFCNHWRLQTNSWTNKTGSREFYMCPQWADADGGLELPEIWHNYEDSLFGVLESLSRFDKMTGYPFSWFFYMVHGNRINHVVGEIVAYAILEGKIQPFPEWDEQVLLQWHKNKYGF